MRNIPTNWSSTTVEHHVPSLEGLAKVTLSGCFENKKRTQIKVEVAVSLQPGPNARPAIT